MTIALTLPSSPGADARDPRDAPGWYGKLASLGDFAQRRLPTPWVQTCDAWLSAAMRAAPEHLGPRWLDVYLTAPVLRFAWAPSVVDHQWWFGLLMPSCDNVGRYFPLLLAQARSHPPTDRVSLDHLELWFEHVSNAAVQTLEAQGNAVDTLEAALHEAPPWPTAYAGTVLLQRMTSLTPSTATTQGQQLRPAGGTPLSQWLPTFAAQDLASRLTGWTLWWRANEAASSDTVSLLRGLPQGADFAELLAGETATLDAPG